MTKVTDATILKGLARRSVSAPLIAFILSITLGSRQARGLIQNHRYRHRFHAKPYCRHRRPLLSLRAHVDSEDQERLLLTEPAVAAYVEAEVRAWLLDGVPPGGGGPDIEAAATAVSAAARDAYVAASRADVLSHHGSLISFVSSELREVPLLPDSLRYLGTNPFGVAKRCVDVLHHRLYRGTYTKTVAPTGAGEAAAREAVGLTPIGAEDGDGDDTCLVEPPPEIVDTDCLWTEGDDAAWRSRRFEKITMEGWRDPRRGNSGTSR